MRLSHGELKENEEIQLHSFQMKSNKGNAKRGVSPHLKI